MARTRTSDHTFRPRHAKRLVYACFGAAALAGSLVTAQGAEGRELGDTTTLADPNVVEEIRTRAEANTKDD